MTREEIEKKIAKMEAGIAELKEKLEKAKDINSDVFIQSIVRNIGQYTAMAGRASSCGKIQ